MGLKLIANVTYGYTAANFSGRMPCVEVSIDSVFILQGGRFMVFNATFNNISAISWLSVISVMDTGVPGENHRPALSH
jgi:hypothetical protein